MRLPHESLRWSPITVIAAIVAVKIVAILLVLPRFETSLAPFYGLGFADDYDKLGFSLSNGDGYRFLPETAPTLTREPGYPLFLAGIFWAFGYSLMAARVANILLVSAAAWLVSRLTAKVSPNRWASVLAPALFLIHPGVVLAELRGGVEAAFILLLICFLTAAWHALSSKRLLSYCIAGLVLGLTSTFRSTALLFPLFFLVYFTFFEKCRPTVRLMVLRLIAVFAGAFLMMSPWIVRNFTLTGQFVPTASVQGTAAHAGNYICTHWSSEKGFQLLDREAADLRADLARQQGMQFKEQYYLYFLDVQDELRFNTFLSKQVLDQYRESPSVLLHCMFRNGFNFWFAGKNSRATMLNVVIQLPYMLLAMAGFVVAFRTSGRNLAVLLALFVIYTLGVYMPIHSQARYSIPVVPILAIFSAIFLARVGEMRSSSHRLAGSSSNQ